MQDSARPLRVATYNVHRWTGRMGRALVPRQAARVIQELDADILALQEVLLPWGKTDLLAQLAADLDMSVIFSATRAHRAGILGNALLSRWTAQHVERLDLLPTRWEYRGAILGRYQLWGDWALSVIATHLALGSRTRDQQVRWLLSHLDVQSGPLVLLGDLNAWYPTPATRSLDRAWAEASQLAWPRTFPSAAPLLALDRIYTRNVRVVELQVHTTPAARCGSDHLPVLAHLML